MAPLPVIEGCYRVTLNGTTSEGITPRNVFHIATASEDVGDVGAAIAAAMADNFVLLPMGANFNPSTFDLIPLDGVTPTQQFPLGSTYAVGTGDSIPEAAAVMSFHTAQRGPRGRGRMFIGPITEATCAGGFLVGSVVDDLEEAWGGFISDMGTGDPAMGLVVASYAHQDLHIVTGFHCDPGIGTQRRRLLQQRA